MNAGFTSRKRTHFNGSGWHGSAFIVEALVLLVFLAAAVAIFVQLFAHATTEATESRELSRAVTAADNAAERFAADPYALDAGDMAFEDLVVVSETTHEPYGTGTLHRATITVYPQNAVPADGAEAADGTATAESGETTPATSGGALFSIRTATYEPAVTAGGAVEGTGAGADAGSADAEPAGSGIPVEGEPSETVEGIGDLDGEFL